MAHFPCSKSMSSSVSQPFVPFSMVVMILCRTLSDSVSMRKLSSSAVMAVKFVESCSYWIVRLMRRIGIRSALEYGSFKRKGDSDDCDRRSGDKQRGQEECGSKLRSSLPARRCRYFDFSSCPNVMYPVSFSPFCNKQSERHTHHLIHTISRWSRRLHVSSPT